MKVFVERVEHRGDGLSQILNTAVFIKLNLQ